MCDVRHRMPIPLLGNPATAGLIQRVQLDQTLCQMHQLETVLPVKLKNQPSVKISQEDLGHGLPPKAVVRARGAVSASEDGLGGIRAPAAHGAVLLPDKSFPPVRHRVIDAFHMDFKHIQSVHLCS